MTALVVCGVLAALVLVLLIASEWTEEKKLREGVAHSFGRGPSAKADIDAADSYYVAKQNAGPRRPVLDSLTWQDLDLDRVYARVNACQTGAGDACLYDLMHCALPDMDALDRREELLQAVGENPALCQQLRLLMARVGRSEGEMGQLLFGDSAGGLGCIWLVRLLSVAWLAAFPLMLVNLGLGFLFLLGAYIANMFLYYWVKREYSGQMMPLRNFSRVLWAGKKLCKLDSQALALLQRELRPLVKTLGPMGGRVAVLFRGGNVYSELFSEYYGILTLSELRSYHKVSKFLDKYRKESVQLYECVGGLDLALGILSCRRYLSRSCVPAFHKENALSFTGLVHPLLWDPVENSARLDNNTLITGSNASGKTTFMKTVAVNCILAQTIHTCTAESFCLRPSYVVTSMAVRDDITQGQSYYMAEMQGLKRILELSREYSVCCFIDEILRGTNRQERLGAASAILRYLTSRDVLCFAATHDLELTDLLGKLYENRHFCEIYQDGQWVFDYRLKSGVCTGGNAIRLLEAAGFPRRIVEEARTLTGQNL